MQQFCGGGIVDEMTKKWLQDITQQYAMYMYAYLVFTGAYFFFGGGGIFTTTGIF